MALLPVVPDCCDCFSNMQLLVQLFRLFCSSRRLENSPRYCCSSCWANRNTHVILPRCGSMRLGEYSVLQADQIASYNLRTGLKEFCQDTCRAAAYFLDCAIAVSNPGPTCAQYWISCPVICLMIVQSGALFPTGLTALVRWVNIIFFTSYSSCCTEGLSGIPVGLRGPNGLHVPLDSGEYVMPFGSYARSIALLSHVKLCGVAVVQCNHGGFLHVCVPCWRKPSKEDNRCRE